MLAKSKLGSAIGLWRDRSGARLSLATNSPVTWQARMRSSTITGVLLASDSSKAISTVSTIVGRLGRGSSSQTCDFMAKAWLRSCMMLAPSP